MRAERSAPVLTVQPDEAALAGAAARWIATAAARAIAARGRALAVLAGGRTPVPVYELLAAGVAGPALDWERIHLFWGDERTVPPDDPASNYGMARRALIERVPIPEANLHRLAGELDPEAAAGAYARELAAVFAGAPPRFDLVLLGLGEDGHTASLFPGSPALASPRWVEAVAAPGGGRRLTLTPLLLNQARHVLFLVSGAAKAAILARALQAAEPPERLPALAIRPAAGRLEWLADAAAAGRPAELRLKDCPGLE